MCLRGPNVDRRVESRVYNWHKTQGSRTEIDEGNSPSEGAIVKRVGGFHFLRRNGVVAPLTWKFT
jgi:hypothetical protein